MKLNEDVDCVEAHLRIAKQVLSDVQTDIQKFTKTSKKKDKVNLTQDTINKILNGLTGTDIVSESLCSKVHDWLKAPDSFVGPALQDFFAKQDGKTARKDAVVAAPKDGKKPSKVASNLKDDTGTGKKSNGGQTDILPDFVKLYKNVSGAVNDDPGCNIKRLEETLNFLKITQSDVKICKSNDCYVKNIDKIRDFFDTMNKQMEFLKFVEDSFRSIVDNASEMLKAP